MQIHYLPNISYFQELLSSDELILHLNDNYSRRTYRNRTEIVGPNGKLILTIPTLKLDPQNRKFDNIKLSYAESWLKQHWRSFESCYRRSIYFEYYEDKFKQIYEKPNFEYLWEFNYELIKIVLGVLKVNRPLLLDKTAEAPINEKYNLKFLKEYQQVFTNKVPFEPNLSILDLIFNTGPQAINFLKI